MNNSIAQTIFKNAFRYILMPFWILFILLTFINVRNEVKERTKVTESFLASANSLLSRPISLGEFAYVENFFSKINVPSYFTEVSIVNSSGETVYMNKMNTEENVSSKQFSVEFEKQLSVEEYVLRATINNADLYKDFVLAFLIALALGSIVTVVIKRLLLRSLKKSLLPLDKLVTAMNEDSLNNMRITDSTPSELIPIIKKIDQLYSANQQIQIKDKLNKLALQVAHDIRSPVMALEAVAGSLESVDQNKKEVLQSVLKRISHIADQLLLQYRDQRNDSYQQYNVTHLVERICSEKKSIDEATHFKVQGDFTKICKTKLKEADLERIISNAINNSIEAFSNGSGEISIDVLAGNDEVKIVIKDNGKGIPAEVLHRITEPGFSFGKKNGNGLGLSHAKELLVALGGNILIESIESKGTKVTLLIPLT